MAIGEVLRLSTGLGPAVTLIALIFAIGIGVGILILTVKNLSRSLAGQNESFMQAIVELKKESDKRDERIEQLIGEQGNKRYGYDYDSKNVTGYSPGPFNS